MMVSSFLPGIGQFHISEGTYNTFDGRAVWVYKIPGAYTVLKIDTSYISHDQLKDTLTLAKIVERIDAYYLSYKNLCGTEPSGGDQEFNFKSSVAFVGPSCGAACGMIGSKGIEASPEMFLQVFNELKYTINTNRIGIVGYEFGRNFFTMGGKLLFPFTPGTDERNGGFAEGFAAVLGLMADLDYLTKQDSSLQLFQETIAYYNQIKNQFLAYINDTSANPYNCMARDSVISDINRNSWFLGKPSGAILLGVQQLFEQESTFSSFFNYLKDRPYASSIEQALGNLAYCFSKSHNYNLLPLFKNVLKFTIDEETAVSIQLLPLAPDRLIYDLPDLWFTTPFDTIPLNIRSVNYLNQQNYYQLYIGDSLISETSNGNNQLLYSLLKNQDSATLTIKLLDFNKNEIDSEKIILRKRNNIDLPQYYQQFTFFDQSGYCKPAFDTGVFSINSIIEKESWSGLEMAFPVKRNRDILVTGQVKNHRVSYPDMRDSLGNYRVNSYSYLSIGGGGGSYGSSRVGYDIGMDDSVSFYDVSFTFNTNGFYTADWSNPLKYISQKVYIFTTGITNGYFKNIIYKDITDTDGDGVIDFEDPCPAVFGDDNGCPKITIVQTLVDHPEIKTYPNPVIDNLIVQGMTKGRISIFDIWGKLLLQEEITDSETQIDVSRFSQGTYIIHFNSENRIQVGKFLKL